MDVGPRLWFMKWELRKRVNNKHMSRPSWNPTSIDCNKARKMASRGLTVAKGIITGKTDTHCEINP